jgi:hypothetical protein
MPMTIAPSNKRTIRQQTNPLDRATIVSICPLEVNEVKHTLQPSTFHIPAASENDPKILVVGPSSWWRDIGEEMPLIEIPNGAILIAESVIKDYCQGMLEISDDAYPGFFFIPGEVTIENIKTNYKDALNEAKRKQKNWFSNLVALADKGWADSNGSPRSINSLMKMAAEHLGYQDRSWMKTTLDRNKVQCVACGNLRNPDFPICPSCNRIVDLALAKKLGIVENPTK